MGKEVKLAFVVKTPPYKSENSKLGATHAMAYQTVEILLEDGENVIPTLCYIGDGVLNCLTNQKSLDHYTLMPIEGHVKGCLLVDIDVMVCKEDLDKFGISADRLPDAEDMGADKKIQVVPYETIQKAMDAADHLLFF